MNIKVLKILGTIFAFLLCFPLHYLYNYFPCFITSVVSPVNESIWEHMKILFTSILISGVIQKTYVIVSKSKFNNICFSNFIAAIGSIPIFLVIFLPIYSTIGENFIITIIIMLITIIISEYISYKIINLKDKKLENITIVLVIIVYIIFAILTYYPLNNDLFKHTNNNTCCIYNIN